jgi:2-dehydro-3-deoxy-D-arabinonate dehydratase
MIGCHTGMFVDLWSGPRLGGKTVPGIQAELLAPVNGRTEVCAAGVTYEHSRTARMAESGNFADAYDRVYDTALPELFFKSAAWRIWNPSVPVSVRLGHRRPRARAGRLLNCAGDVVGYTVCDDMSSRSIEGENPRVRCCPRAPASFPTCRSRCGG